MITEDLERLAERGPYGDPPVVVASAVAESDAARSRARRIRTVAIAAVSVALIAGVVVALVVRSGVDPDEVASSPSTVDEPEMLLPLSSIVEGDEVVVTDLPDGWVVDDPEFFDGIITRAFRDPGRDAMGSVNVGFGNVDNVDPDGELRRLGGVDWYVTVVEDRSTSYMAVSDDVFFLVGGTGFDPVELDRFVASLRASGSTGTPDSARGDDVTDPLADLSDDDWVVPAALPDGYEVIVAMTLGGTKSPDGQILVGGDDVEEVSISAHASGNQDVGGAGEEATGVESGEPDSPVEAVDIGGVEWQLRAIVDDEGATLGHALERYVSDRRVFLSTSGGSDDLIEIAAALRPVPDDALDAPRLSFDSDAFVTVTSLDATDVAAHGVNGVYCVSINAPDGTSSRSCAARTEPGTPIVHSLGLSGQEYSYAAGVAEPDVARIEFVAANGPSVVVVPTDASGSFGHRFWVTDQPAATSGRAVITYDNGTTATLEQTRPGRWTLAEETSDTTEPVVVANASDTAGIAGATTLRLGLGGYNVLEAVNAAASVGALDESIVYARAGHESLRDDLAALLAIDATATLDPQAPLPIDGTDIDHDQVAVLVMLGRDFTLTPDPDTITHADFAVYVAQARDIFGDIYTGDSCQDWPDRNPIELAHLVVVPASNGDGSPCQIRGWTYHNGLAPDDVPADATITRDDGTSPGPIFDDGGNVIGHFDPPLSSAG